MKINDNLTEHIDGLRTYYKSYENSNSDEEDWYNKKDRGNLCKTTFYH